MSPEVDAGGGVGFVSSLLSRRGLPRLVLSPRGAPSLMKAGLQRAQVCNSTIGRPETKFPVLILTVESEGLEMT